MITPTPPVTDDLAPKYAPLEVEREVAARWAAVNAFHAEPSDPGEPYAIVIPPPNVTAALHMGHALNNTLQDILTRYHRMLGDNTMWMPGTDHAGIATQTIVDKRLREEGQPGLADYKRLEIEGGNGRAEFLKKVQAWKDEYEAFITNQLKMMGCSCDWDRQRFTMDEVCAKSVREAFFQLFKDGLIYRGKRLVNWDPVSLTALADDEVEMEEVDGFFYYLKYEVVEGVEEEEGTKARRHEGTKGGAEAAEALEGSKPSVPSCLNASVPSALPPSVPSCLRASVPSYITVATTRPETMLGDTAVAINPKDPRAASLRGKFVKLPIVNRIIPIVEDDYVVLPIAHGGDPADTKAQFATGFLKVTPAHDPNDYEIGRRHNLPVINIMAPDASISKDHGWPAEEWDAAQAPPGRARADTSTTEKGDTIVNRTTDGPHPSGWGLNIDPFAHTLLGKSREQARKLIVDWFKQNNLLEEMKPYKHSVGHSYRSHVPVEPYLSDQWYVKVTDDRLAGAALRAMSRDQFDATSSTSKAHGQESVGFAGDSSCEGKLRFHPERYAKTFQQWHENIRDWCISRQLWWGHRIPVWTATYFSPVVLGEGQMSPFLPWVQQWQEDGRLFFHGADDLYDGLESKADYPGYYICIRDASDDEVIRFIEAAGFTQDPDVLDTWFSSGLWPISTLGWPDENPALQKWNPSNTLCTAREIITLWVSRMVMFNIYFRGCLPFKDVFIHAMIQDGHGQKMSKTLGNGIDPLDIIHSHGSDAMRFTLTGMTTQTQDVRMPVDIVCPHCSSAFTPKFTQSKGGTVAAPMQECPACKKPMTSSYGGASGKAKPTAEAPVARNTSEKFDYGRNFANKLWNAVRFALGYVKPSDADHWAIPSIADQWILARLSQTVIATTKALDNYEFKVYSDTLYDFIRRDFCDWYIEAIKPTVAAAQGQQRVLVTVIDAILRMLHPAMPFITEKLWERLNIVAPKRTDLTMDGLFSLTLGESALLVKAPWPRAMLDADGAAKVEARFESIRQIVGGLREVRTSYKVAPRLKVDCAIRTTGPASESLREDMPLIATLANVRITAIGPATMRSEDAAAVTVGELELYLAGLIDKDAEKTRRSKHIAELEKSIAGLKARLSNKAYTDKAPAKLVQETREQLANAEKELESVKGRMEG